MWQRENSRQQHTQRGRRRNSFLLNFAPPAIADRSAAIASDDPIQAAFVRCAGRADCPGGVVGIFFVPLR